MTRTKRNAPPDPNSPRVYRGGCWFYNVPWWVRAAARNTIDPATRFNDIGFRTALAGRQPR